MAFRTWEGGGAGGVGLGASGKFGRAFSLRPSNPIETKSIHVAILFSNNLKIMVSNTCILKLSESTPIFSVAM